MVYGIEEGLLNRSHADFFDPYSAIAPSEFHGIRAAPPVPIEHHDIEDALIVGTKDCEDRDFHGGVCGDLLRKHDKKYRREKECKPFSPSCLHR
jgi:hypothetical protein